MNSQIDFVFLSIVNERNDKVGPLDAIGSPGFHIG